MPFVFAFFTGPLPWLVLAVVTVVCLWVDLHFFARGRQPSFREGVIWSIGWLVVSLLAAVVVWILSDADDAITYTTVYFIERSLSLDNLFVFILLFSYFGVPEEYRARLLFWGIVAALVLRGVNEDMDPDRTLLVRAARRVLPVTHGFRDGHWFSREDGRLHATPPRIASPRMTRAAAMPQNSRRARYSTGTAKYENSRMKTNRLSSDRERSMRYTVV